MYSTTDIGNLYLNILDANQQKGVQLVDSLRTGEFNQQADEMMAAQSLKRCISTAYWQLTTFGVKDLSDAGIDRIRDCINNWISDL